MWGEAPRMIKIRKGPKCLDREPRTRASGVTSDDPQDGWIDEDEEIDLPLIELSYQPAWEETS